MRGSATAGRMAGIMNSLSLSGTAMYRLLKSGQPLLLQLSEHSVAQSRPGGSRPVSAGPSRESLQNGTDEEKDLWQLW